MKCIIIDGDEPINPSQLKMILSDIGLTMTIWDENKISGVTIRNKEKISAIIKFLHSVLNKMEED